MDDESNYTYVFAPSDLDYIASILRGAFQIRTAAGEEDELLGDFIEALEEGDCICCEEPDENEEEEAFSFFPGD